MDYLLDIQHVKEAFKMDLFTRYTIGQGYLLKQQSLFEDDVL